MPPDAERQQQALARREERPAETEEGPAPTVNAGTGKSGEAE
jgi:hypothetical protein